MLLINVKNRLTVFGFAYQIMNAFAKYVKKLSE